MTIPGVPYQNPTSYVGPQMNLVPITMFYRPPTTTDKKYRVGSVAILGKDPTSGTQGDLWYLSKFDSSGDAIWIQFAGGASAPGIDFILTDEGEPPVEPTAGGVVSVLGGSGIVTSGSGGNTVTISDDGTYATTYTEDTGTAEPSSNNLNILGTGGLTTSGSGSTVTVTTDGTIATSYVEDTGSAIPSMGILNILGTGGIATSGTGSTVTVDGSAIAAISSINVQTFSSTDTYTPTSGMAFAMVYITGAGGGGGGAITASSSQVSCAGGGGGGGTAVKLVTAADIGASKTVTIGTGGSPGADTGTSGGDGGDSSINTSTPIVGSGGSGGNLSNSSNSLDIAPPRSVVSGTGGDFYIPGTVSAAAFGVFLGSLAMACGGNGGGSYFSGGRVPRCNVGTSVSQAGNDGILGGGAGGGISTDGGAGAAGGTGGDGYCVIIEYII